MSNDWFFEKFALISDAPGAVARMRELVLDLAVRGKLMPQDPNEEPAKETLKRVDAEREQLVKAKGIRRHDTLGPVPVEAIPFAIPVNWQWCYLADVCFLITDGAHHTPQYLESGVPFLSVKDVSRGSIDFSSTRYISEEAHRELCKRCQPELGDVLLTKVGTTGIAVNVEDDRDFSIFVSLALLKFSQPNLDGRFLTYLINSPFVRQQSAKNTQGIGNKNLVLRLINRFIVPLPPLAEQKRIVAKVEELMGICDALEAQQQELESRKSVLVRSSLSRFAESPTPENLGYLFHKSYHIPPSELRKSILTLAVQGKLVPQDPNDEPAAEIKMQIARQMSGMRNQRYHTFAAIEEQTDPPFSVPQNWEWMPFGSLGEFLGGGTPSKDNPAYWNGEIPWVSPKDMKRSHIKDSIDHVTPLGADASSGRLIPTGALLMVVRGMILAHTFPVAITQREVTINQDMKALRLAVPEIGEYLLRCCTALTIAMLSNVERSSHGTCRIPTEALSSFLVPIPPLAEQNRIVAKVDQLMALVDELERQQEASREKASKLLDAIVQEMTSGGRDIAATLES